MAYACRILADSISPADHRLTSFEVTFPRIVLAEVNTHCMLARNSASSRAIPVKKRIAAVAADPLTLADFIPEVFGRNQKGMQPGEALEDVHDRTARDIWGTARQAGMDCASALEGLGVHKQYANRLLEPFSWHTAVITATDFDNLFHLRVNSMAQGEFQKAAMLMRDARDASTPVLVNYGDWHLPYVRGVTPETQTPIIDSVTIGGKQVGAIIGGTAAEEFSLRAAGHDPVAISAARCARLSYLTQNGDREPGEDMKLFSGLIGNGHMSPLEHPARPMTERELYFTRSFDIAFDDGPILRMQGWHEIPKVGAEVSVGLQVATVTYLRGPLHYAGKLNGWVSRRQFVHGEHDILGHRAS